MALSIFWMGTLVTIQNRMIVCSGRSSLYGSENRASVSLFIFFNEFVKFMQPLCSNLLEKIIFYKISFKKNEQRMIRLQLRCEYYETQQNEAVDTSGTCILLRALFWPVFELLFFIAGKIPLLQKYSRKFSRDSEQ